jgi:outer membrane biogenesis lipoprotein LolB
LKSEYKPTSKRVLGEIEPIGKLAILRGDAKYTNDGRSVEITVRIESNKSKWQNRYLAYRIEQNGNTKKITVRIKHPKQKLQLITD